LPRLLSRKDGRKMAHNDGRGRLLRRLARNDGREGLPRLLSRKDGRKMAHNDGRKMAHNDVKPVVVARSKAIAERRRGERVL